VRLIPPFRKYSANTLEIFRHATTMASIDVLKTGHQCEDWIDI
jgi:hypothetical protein